MENKKFPFKLSKVNWIFAIIVIVISAFVFFRDEGINAYSLGSFTGRIVFAGIIPLSLSLFVWLLRGRKEYAGTHTFNIVLALMCFGIVKELGAIRKDKNESVLEISQSYNELKDKLANDVDPNEAFNEHTKNIDNSLQKLINTSTGNEQKVYIKLKEFSEINIQVQVEWENSYDSVMNPRILDYSFLNSSDEFQYQKSVLKYYEKNSENFKRHFLERESLMTELFTGIPEGNTTLQGVIRGIKKKDSIQEPVIIPYLNHHISYSQNMIDLLDFMEKSSGKWIFENDELLFETIELEESYSGIIEKIAEDEDQINQLADKIVEVL